MIKQIIAAALLCGLAGPAMAQTSTTTTTSPSGDQFYIVRDSTTRRCTVTTTRPTTSTTTTTVVGDTVYKTRSEADAAVTKVCTN